MPLLKILLVIHLHISPLLRRIALILEHHEPVPGLREYQIALSGDDYVRHLVVGAFFDENGAWIKDPLGHKVVEFGFEALGEVVEPFEAIKKICLLLILAAIR